MNASHAMKLGEETWGMIAGMWMRNDNLECTQSCGLTVHNGCLDGLLVMVLQVSDQTVNTFTVFGDAVSLSCWQDNTDKK